MGKIKKILENELVGGTQATDVYPVTSTKAVYDENNERLDNVLGGLEDKIGILKNAGYLYKDVATPTTDPGTPEAKVFYIAYEPGTYMYFNNIQLYEGELSILKWNTEWVKEIRPINVAETGIDLSVSAEKRTQTIISQNGDPIVYVGKWGTQTRDGGHRNLWTDIREKDQAQLINLAIVRVKEEQDFIDNTIMKFVEVLHDLELIEQNLYLTLKYGTANAVEIVLIKNGVSLSLTQLLIEKYSDSISVNLLTDTVLFSKELVNKMKQNDENQILIYEAMTNTF